MSSDKPSRTIAHLISIIYNCRKFQKSCYEVKCISGENSLEIVIGSEESHSKNQQNGNKTK